MGKKIMQLYSCDEKHMDSFVRALTQGYNIIKKYRDQKSFDIIEMNPRDIGVFWFKTDTWEYILKNIEFIKEQPFWSMFIYQTDPDEESMRKCLVGAKKLEQAFGGLEKGTITIKLNIREVEDFLKTISMLPIITQIPSVERVILYLGERKFNNTVLLQNIPKVKVFTDKYKLKLSTCHSGEVKGLEKYSTGSPCIDNNISNKLLNATNAVCKVNYENLSEFCRCHKALSLTGAEVDFNREKDKIKKSHLEKYAAKFGLTEFLSNVKVSTNSELFKKLKLPRQLNLEKIDDILGDI